jgi:gamma-glutamyltranspeptidase/glutathione hydrolase
MWNRGFLALLASASLMAADQGDRYTGDHFATRSAVLGRNGMAATSHPIASAIAIDILKRGGSAVDAAIAANAMLGLVEPHACGIGGDLFAIVWDPAKQELNGYNGSGRSPAAMTRAALQAALDGATSMPLYGPLSVSVPGAVAGWFDLHERYGKLPMNEVLAPAIAYAGEGVAVTEVDAALWGEALGEFGSSGLPEPWFAGLFATYTVAGKSPQAGQVFRNPDLAASYRQLAAGGREAFYTGELGQRIVATVQGQGGHLSMDDLAAHRGEWVTPVAVNYRGYDVYELPPNSQGIAALQMLNLLEAYPLASIGRGNADYWHLLVEAGKLAYADRAKFYADPAFGEIPLDWLLSEAYASERRALIDMQHAAQTVPSGMPPHGDTTYLAVADKDGMMVSWIQSNYWEFGSGLVPQGGGFALQNRGSSFSLEAGHANEYAPGKRPFHTIIPAFVMREDAPLMAFGVMGGYLQPQMHVQIVSNLVDFGMNPQEAGDAARMVHQGDSQPTGETMADGGVVHMESGIPNEVVEELRRRGHSVTRGERRYIGAYGGYQAIWRDPRSGVYQGASEMRYDGAAAGY